MTDTDDPEYKIHLNAPQYRCPLLISLIPAISPGWPQTSPGRAIQVDFNQSSSLVVD